MKNAKKSERNLEGHYNYYGIPSYILKQKNGAYASGFYDPIDGIFKAGGSAIKILWDGVRISEREARKLIREYSRQNPILEDENGETPEWILLPEEAILFMTQYKDLRDQGVDIFKKLNDLELNKEEEGPGEKKRG